MKIFAGFYGIQFCLVKIRSEFVNYKEMPGSYFSPPTRPPRLARMAGVVAGRVHREIIPIFSFVGLHDYT
jgi:hypothetical protein